MEKIGLVSVLLVSVILGPSVWFTLGYYTMYGFTPDVELLFRITEGWVCLLSLAFLCFLLSN